jgi:hypothetical protein
MLKKIEHLYIFNVILILYIYIGLFDYVIVTIHDCMPTS